MVREGSMESPARIGFTMAPEVGDANAKNAVHFSENLLQVQQTDLETPTSIMILRFLVFALPSITSFTRSITTEHSACAQSVTLINFPRLSRLNGVAKLGRRERRSNKSVPPHQRICLL